MTRLLLAAAATAALSALSGCGPGVGEGPIRTPPPDDTADSGTDSDSDSDSDADSGTAAPTCPEFPPVECPDDELDPPALLLEASAVGPNLELVDLDNDALLARRETDAGVTSIVVAAQLDAEEEALPLVLGVAELAFDDGGPATPVALATRLAAPFDDGGTNAVILVEASGAYALYGSTAAPGEDGVITALPNGGVPTTGEARGLVYLRNKVDGDLAELPEMNRVCAFGDGLFCFDGADWLEEIPAGAGAPLSAVTVLDDGLEGQTVAVGDGGRIAVKTGGAWQELDLGDDADLAAASAHPGRFTAAGDGLLVDGDADGQLVCAEGGGSFVSLNWSIDLAEPGASYFIALSATGEILRGSVGEGAGELCDTGHGVPGAKKGRLLKDGSFYAAITAGAVYRQRLSSSAVPVD
jgi:predicted small lipoprotein YifL